MRFLPADQEYRLSRNLKNIIKNLQKRWKITYFNVLLYILDVPGKYFRVQWHKIHRIGCMNKNEIFSLLFFLYCDWLIGDTMLYSYTEQNIWYLLL